MDAPEQDCENVLRPEFDGWKLREVRGAVVKSFLTSLQQGGVRGFGIAAALTALVTVAYLSLTATGIDPALKALCVSLVVFAILVIAVVTINSKEEVKYAAANKETGNDPSKLGGHSGNKGTSGSVAGGDGGALDGGNYQPGPRSVRDPDPAVSARKRRPNKDKAREGTQPSPSSNVIEKAPPGGNPEM